MGSSGPGKSGWGVRKVGSGQIQNRELLVWFLGIVGSSVLQGLGDVALERTEEILFVVKCLKTAFSVCPLLFCRKHD